VPRATVYALTMRRNAISALSILLLAAQAPAQSGPNDARAKDIFKQLIEIDTSDTPHGSVTAAATAMGARFKAAGFDPADIQILGPAAKKMNLLVRYRGTGAKKPILLLAHLDVVDAKREDWSVDPFVFLEKEGYYYGRGTTDDKAMATHLVANLLRLKAEGFKPDRDFILALTADEESGDFNGPEWLVKNKAQLASNPVVRELWNAEFALNEGGGGTMRGGKYLTNEIQASEKVYQDFELESTNPGGHSSLPVKDNAIYHLSAGIGRLAAFDFPVALNEITRGYFERSAEKETDPKVAADMRAVAKQPPDPQAVARLSASLPYWNSMMRTTCVATRLSAGHANNALPQKATALVNCRVLPGVDPKAVKAELEKVIADPKVTVKFVGEATPSQPSPLRPDVMGALETITKEMYPGVVIVPVMSTGATDSLYFRNAGIPTYGIDGTFGDVDDVRAHGRDERIGIRQFYEGLEFNYRLLKALSK